MRLKHKRSKITDMRRNGRQAGAVLNQQGMASIVVVSVLVIIMTLISIGFARLVSRSSTSSANRQFSNSATYAAQSAINDVAAYLKQYAAANPGSSFLPKSTKCSGAGSLIGSAATPGPFYNDSNLSGDASRSTQYTCLLLNPTPDNLVYTQVASLKSQVVKVNTSAATGALDKLMISWQPSDISITGYPTSTSSLNDQTTWNSSTGICKDGSNANASCIPILRLSIYPVANTSVLSSLQAKSKTIFLYPQSPTGNVAVKSFTDNVNFKDGSIVPVPCTQTVGAGNFTPSTNSDYKCNIIIGALSGAIAPDNTDSVYLRLTPIYNQADIKIRANDKFGDTLNFISDQAIIDATAQTAGVAKRLQARVDTSSLAANANGVDSNISSSSNSVPEQSVRVANALCKREVQTITSVGFSSYINFDDPDNVCHDLGGTSVITNPVPTLTFNITGNNGQDGGLKVDSEANNPDGGQNPVQPGTVYVGSPGVPGNITLNWTTTDARFCTATGGNGGDGWSGDQTGHMTFSGSPQVNGTASPQTFSGINSVTEYDLTCGRALAPSNTPTKKVVAWPYPQVSVTAPGTVEAGSNYTISWSSVNTIKCALSGGSWTDSSKTGTSDSEVMNWPVNDNTSTRTYTVTCVDPAGRSATDTKTLSPSNSSGNGKVVPPNCNASVSFTGSSTSDANVSWSTSCDYWDAANQTFSYSRYVDTNVPGIPTGPNTAGNIASGSVRISSPGSYYMQIYVWATPWASQADGAGTGCSSGCAGAANSGRQSLTIYAPLVITDFSVAAWDQGPDVCSNTVLPTADRGKWHCRNNVNVVNDSVGCPDDLHRYTSCPGSTTWTAARTNGDTSNIACVASSTYGRYIVGGPNGLYGPYGWGTGFPPDPKPGSPYPFDLACATTEGSTDHATWWPGFTRP